MYCPTCRAQYPNGAFCANDGSALVEEGGAGLVGQVLADRYRILRLLGEGGMGQVYEAKHLNINKRFAIKLLRPEVIGSPQSLQRFRQEAWAASSIGHENIVEIDDFATLPSGQVYLAMEFLDGMSLAERLREGAPLSLGEAVAVAVAVGRGLAAAHEKGIVHRDMKPENVFLARKPGAVVAKILDFGIAKVSGGDEASNLTRTGAIFGTPLYMSPEQARGKPADARADVYALGVILYELLTGSVPFGGDSSVEILNQHISAAPVPPSQLAPDRAIPAALETLVVRALAKEPDARFGTMSELVQELEAVARSLPATHLHRLLAPAPATAPRGSAPIPRAETATPAGAPRALAATPMPTSQKGAPTPPGPSAARGAAPSRAAISRPVVTEPPQPPGTPGARNLAVILLGLALVGGSMYLLVWRTRPLVSTPIVGTAPVTPPSAPVTPPSAPAPPVTTTPTPSTMDVLLDSLPTGAQIMRDGDVVGETPEMLKLAAPVTVVLRRGDFADKRVVIDPGKTRKLMIKLERVRPVAVKGAPRSETPVRSAPMPTPVGSAAVTTPKRTARAPLATKSATPPMVATKNATAPSNTHETLEPYKTPRAVAWSPPSGPKPPRDELGARVESHAAEALPGGHRLGTIYRGAAASDGGRSDWFVELENGRCYTFVAEGGDGVKALYLYLWGPRGRRVRDTRESTEHAQMTYCTVASGSYHVQAKVDDGQGEYRLGIYSR